MKNILSIVYLIWFFFLSFTAELQPGDIPKTALPIIENQSITYLENLLLSEGFENIVLQINAHREIIIEYENRIYRNELTALSIVLKYSSQILVAFDKFYIVPKQRNIPLMTISTRAAYIRQFLNHEMSEAEFAEVITIDHGTLKKMDNFFYRTSPRQNSFFKSDFVIHPGFKAQFSRPNDPAQLQLSLKPTIRTPITTGLQFEAQMNFPFYNEFDTTSYSPTFSKIICNYIFRPAVHHFVSLS
ncbi:hypothetical protein GF337_08745, partial [candidate division KSB1 bacterium]|nr:hypothetical protein [candidate division KSB1 bacterium]